MSETCAQPYKHVLASSLKGPRVYSTDLHPNLFDNNRKDELIEVTVRSLKIKLITKGVVTINGRHFMSPLAIEIFKEFPEILGNSLLLPALREDKTNFGDFTADYENLYADLGWSRQKIDDHVQFVEENVRSVLPWKLENIGELYRERVTGGLLNEKSQIHRKLMELPTFRERDLQTLVDEINALDMSEERGLQEYIDQQIAPVKANLRPFSTACYHLVGTAVVNCETGTDLSPLSQLKVEELTSADSMSDVAYLSDEGIFLRCFLATAMDVIHAVVIPTAVIDALSFRDIALVRGALQEQGFQDKYDQLVHEFLNNLAANDKRSALENWNPESTIEIVEGLSKHFREYIENELPDYRTRTQENHVQDAIRSGADTVKQGLGMVPGVGEIMAIYEGAKSAYETVDSGIRAVRNLDHETALETAQRIRDQNIEEAIGNMNLDNSAKLLNAVGLLNDIFIKKVRRA